MREDQLAVSMWSVHRSYDHGWSVLDFLDAMETMDMPNVELLNFFWRDVSAEVPEVARRIDRGRVRVKAWAVANDFSRQGMAEYGNQVKEIIEGVAMAKRLGAPVVRVFTGDLREGIELDAVVNSAVRGLQEAAQVAEREGIRLVIENHGRLAGKSNQILDLIERIGSSAVAANADIANFLLADEDPLLAISRLASKIRHVHVKDLVPSTAGAAHALESLAGIAYQGTTVGDGVIGWPDVIASLDQMQYEGTLSLEYEGPGDEIVGVQRSLTYLRSLTMPK